MSKEKLQKAATKSLHGGHIVYFVSVAASGHGAYAIVAGVMAALSVVVVFLGGEDA